MCLTLAGGVLARNAGSSLLLLPKEASNGRLDTLLLGCFVEGVLAAVTTAGVTTLTILKASKTVGPGGGQQDKSENRDRPKTYVENSRYLSGSLE